MKLNGVFLFCLTLVLSLPAFADEPVPPEFLFHVGKKSALQQDSMAGNIPSEAWDKYIMGKDTRYGLTPFRRGLYGAESPDGLELYGNLLVGKDEPWLMKIQIKESCRNSQAATSLYQDPLYGEWIAAHLDEILSSSSNCLNANATSCLDLIDGQNVIAEGKAENACDQALDHFLRDRGAKIVQDSEWDDSWYIRDRDCIQSLKASAEDELEMLAHDFEWDWKSRKSTFAGTNGYGVSEFEIMVAALAEAKDPSPALLKELGAKLEQSDIHAGFDPKDTSDFPWVKIEGPKVLAAFDRCRQANQGSEFRREAAGFAQSQKGAGPDAHYGLDAIRPIQAFTARLDKLCR